MSWQVGLYVAAVLIPLAAFAVQLLAGKYLKRLNAYIATGAIAASFLLSLIGFVSYFVFEAKGVFAHHGEAHAEATPGGRPNMPKPITPGPRPASMPETLPPAPLAWTWSTDWTSVGEKIPDRVGSSRRCRSPSECGSTTSRRSCS